MELILILAMLPFPFSYRWRRSSKVGKIVITS
jgi:hypothetical protein